MMLVAMTGPSFIIAFFSLFAKSSLVSFKYWNCQLLYQSELVGALATDGGHDHSIPLFQRRNYLDIAVNCLNIGRPI